MVTVLNRRGVQLVLTDPHDPLRTSLRVHPVESEDEEADSGPRSVEGWSAAAGSS